jgi:hypothetical protein
MGTLAHLAPVLGLVAGLIITKLTPYEFKQGKKYFKMLMYALAAVIIGTAVWQYAREQIIDVSILFFLFFISIGTLFHKKYAILIGVAAIYIAVVLIAVHA